MPQLQAGNDDDDNDNERKSLPGNYGVLNLPARRSRTKCASHIRFARMIPLAISVGEKPKFAITTQLKGLEGSGVSCRFCRERNSDSSVS